MGTYATNMRDRKVKMKTAQAEKRTSLTGKKYSSSSKTYHVGRKSRRRKLDELHTLG